MTDFIETLPKAELHVHIEGTLEPEMMFALAADNGVTLPYASVAALRAAYRFDNLQDFLDLYYQGMDVLRRERDFYALTRAYLERAAADAVRHVEIFFDPQAHTARGIPFATVLDGIHGALRDGGREYGISSRLIACFLRHLDATAAEATLDEVLAHRDRIIGIGLDSTECGNPPGKFAAVFARARAAGLQAVAHAGEEGPAAYVGETLDKLKVARIDHGNRALDDEALVRRLVAARVPLTVCPLSNLKLGLIADMADHPLKTMLNKGLLVTVNSDDPAYFGGYVNANYRAVRAALGLSDDMLATLARNSFTASFLDEADKAAAIAAVDAHTAA